MKAGQPCCARHNEPRRQNGQSRAFSRRVSEANCPEGKRGPSGALGAAQSDPQGGWEASRATGRELCDTGHPVLEESPKGSRRPKPTSLCAVGRLWSRRAAGFLLHTFLSPPKEKCERPLGRPVPTRAGVGASFPIKGDFFGKVVACCCKQRGFPLAPLHPLRIANRNNRAPHRAASSSPAPESARQTPPGAGDCACGHSPANTGASPCKPLPFKEASP